MNEPSALALFDAGTFIAALLRGDVRHAEARAMVEAARRGDIFICTTTGILSEVYAALTWEKAQPRHPPAKAAAAVRLLVEPPSSIRVISSGLDTILLGLTLAARHKLTARRVHDARHAAEALLAGAQWVYTYDWQDWQAFERDGLKIAGPPSTLFRLGRSGAQSDTTRS